MTSVVSVLGTSVIRPVKPTTVGADSYLAEPCEAVGVSQDLRVATLSAEQLARPEGMKRFSRLDRYGQLIAALCEDVLRTNTRPEAPEDNLGVCAISKYSCHQTNAAYDRELIERGPKRASPLLFPYTLPGSTLSEAAMHFQLRGAYLVFPGGPASALVALLTAVDMLETGMAEELLVLAADVLGAETLRHELPEVNPRGLGAAVPMSEGGAALWLGRGADPAEAAHPRRGPQLGLSGLWLGASPSADEIQAAAQSLVTGRPDEILVATESLERARWEAEAVVNAYPGCPITQLCWRVGAMGAPLGLSAVISALEENTESLIIASDPSGSALIHVTFYSK